MNLSRSRMAYALRVMVTTVLATSAILVPTGIASAADTETPVLTSFAVSDTQVIPGQRVTFSYVATDGAVSLKTLRLGYLDSHGHTNVLTPEGPFPTTGSVVATIPDNWWNGPHTLTYVVLGDASDNGIVYYRNGSVYVSPGSTGPASHTLSLAPGDLTLSGSDYEMAVPVLTALSAAAGPVHPGETLKINYEATEASGALKSVVLSFRNKYKSVQTFSSTTTGPLPLNGSVDQVIPTTWPNGDYLLYSATLTDRYLNQGIYLASGTVSVSPSGAQGPASHSLDFGLATFAVAGSTADFTPPVLTSVIQTGSPTRPGVPATVTYEIESQDPLTKVLFTYVDSQGRFTSFSPTSLTPTGTIPVGFPLGSTVGDHTLRYVTLQDSARNSVTYYRDGTTTQTPGPIAGTHAVALSSADVFVGTPPSAPPMLGAFTRSGSAVVSWDPADPSGSLVTQYTVTAQPGGRTANFSGSATYGEFTGLTNDTVYRFTVTATNAFGTSPASAPSNAVTPRMSTAIIAGRDFTGDGRTDLIGLRAPADPRDFSRTPYLYRGNGLGGFASGGQRLSNPWGSFPVMFSSPDFNGDGKNDVFGIEQSGALFEFDGTGRAGFYPGMPIGNGWGALRSVFGPGDFSGDRKSDIMTVRKDGGLYLYRGNGYGGFTGAGQKIGTGWGTFLTVFSPGDFTGDGKSGVMAVSKDGGLYLFRGNGLGRFTGGAQRIGNGWGGFLSVFSPGDFTGDRKSDVMAVKTNGDLILYRGNGRGGWTGGGLKIGAGWSIFR